MYKVFINDKEVRFLKDSEIAMTRSQELIPLMTSEQIVSFVQTFHSPDVRIFNVKTDDPKKRFEKFIEYFPVIRAAGGVVRSKNLSGPVLMIYRLGKWDLPKGKIDPGERPEEAAIREVQEECGIGDLRIINKVADTFHLYENRNVTVLKTTNWYLMLSDDESTLQPQTEEGITAVKWVHEKDIYFLLPVTYASIADLLSQAVLNS